MDSRDFGVRHLRFISCLWDLPALWHWAGRVRFSTTHPFAYSKCGPQTTSISIYGVLVSNTDRDSGFTPDSLTTTVSLSSRQFMVTLKFEEPSSVSLCVKIYRGLWDNWWPGLELSSKLISNHCPPPSLSPLYLLRPPWCPSLKKLYGSCLCFIHVLAQVSPAQRDFLLSPPYLK